MFYRAAIAALFPMHIEKITLPYSVAGLITEQQRLIKIVPIRRFTGKQLTDSDLKTLAICLQVKSRREDIPLSFFLSSLDQFRHRTVDEGTLHQFFRQMAAVIVMNEIPMQPVEPWLVQQKDEWIPLEVTSVVSEEPLISFFHCRPLGSRMIGHEFDYKVSLRMAYRIASYAGFNQRADLKRMLDTLQFVDLRLLLRIAKGSTHGSVKVLDCGQYSPFVTYNMKINKLRDPEFRKCPFNQKTVCFRCGIGKDQCNLAVREQTNGSERCR